MFCRLASSPTMKWVKGSPMVTVLLVELTSTGGKPASMEPAPTRTISAATIAGVGVVHVQGVTNTDNQLCRGVTDDFLGFFESFLADDVLQADTVLDFECAFEQDVECLGHGLSDIVCTGRYGSQRDRVPLQEDDDIGAVGTDIDDSDGLVA